MGALERFSLAGKVALVTGASRGIGGGIALALAEAGADVAIVGRDVATLRAQAERVERGGRRCLPIALDVREIDRLPAMVETVIDALGRLDVLVNAAGAVARRPMLDATVDDFDRVVDTNLRAVYFASCAAARAMIARRERDPAESRGKIINIASLTSQIALPNIASYVASRAGVLGLTRSMALEWREHINANALAPGYIRTQQTEPLFQDRAWVDRTTARIPLGRTGEVDDIVGAAVFLASSASDYVTGQILYVDGGWLAAG